jgi:hypothetical protein
MDSLSIVPRDKGFDGPLPNFSSLMSLRFRNSDSAQLSYSLIQILAKKMATGMFVETLENLQHSMRRIPEKSSNSPNIH